MRARGAEVSLQMGKGSYCRAPVLGLVVCSPFSLAGGQAWMDGIGDGRWEMR